MGLQEAAHEENKIVIKRPHTGSDKWMAAWREEGISAKSSTRIGALRNLADKAEMQGVGE